MACPDEDVSTAVPRQTEQQQSTGQGCVTSELVRFDGGGIAEQDDGQRDLGELADGFRSDRDVEGFDGNVRHHQSDDDKEDRRRDVPPLEADRHERPADERGGHHRHDCQIDPFAHVRRWWAPVSRPGW